MGMFGLHGLVKEKGYFAIDLTQIVNRRKGKSCIFGNIKNVGRIEYLIKNSAMAGF